MESSRLSFFGRGGVSGASVRLTPVCIPKVASKGCYLYSYVPRCQFQRPLCQVQRLLPKVATCIPTWLCVPEVATPRLLPVFLRGSVSIPEVATPRLLPIPTWLCVNSRGCFPKVASHSYVALCQFRGCFPFLRGCFPLLRGSVSLAEVATQRLRYSYVATYLDLIFAKV